VTAKTRRQLLLLGLLIVVGAALYYWLRPDRTVSQAAQPGGAAPTARPGTGAGDVRLDLLEARSEDRLRLDRNLFQFEARRAPESGIRQGGAVAQAPPLSPASTGPPPLPPIPLRFIGYLDQPGAVPRVAVLSDGRGNVFNGKEGDIIEGRYRLLRIGTDSADLVYVDGRGRQTIRLSGQ